jgi:thiol-disulfide isomerase/thioredoxin
MKRWRWLLMAVGLASCATFHMGPKERPSFSMQAETLEQAPVTVGGPGKVRVIEFWATWCPACARSMPVFEEWLGKHPEVDSITVSIDDDMGALRSYLAEHPRRGQMLHFPGGNPAATQAGLKGVPLFVVLDAQGRVVRSIYGMGPELTDVLGDGVVTAGL